MTVKANKRRGFAFEKELADEAEVAGLDARRAWGSNGEALGHHAEVDVLIEGRKVQAKRRKAIAAALIPSLHVDAVVTRIDAKPGHRKPSSLVVIRFEDWLEMLFRDKEAKRIIGQSFDHA